MVRHSFAVFLYFISENIFQVLFAFCQDLRNFAPEGRALILQGLASPSMSSPLARKTGSMCLLCEA